MSFDPSRLPDLSGKVYIVTGGTAGIGQSTVQHLASKNATVYLCARSASKASETITSIASSLASSRTGNIHPLSLNLLSLASVRSCAEQFLSLSLPLHGLVNSAGIMATPTQFSEDGFEAQWQTNYLSHFLLTYLLLPALLRTPGARVVNVSSSGHTFAPRCGIKFDDINLKGPWERYGQSKLGNILHAKELARRYSQSGLWTAALHPGEVDTGLVRATRGMRAVAAVLRCTGQYIDADKGSWTSVACVAGKEWGGDETNARYWVPFGTEKVPSKLAVDADLAGRLWEWSVKALKERGFISVEV